MRNVLSRGEDRPVRKLGRPRALAVFAEVLWGMGGVRLASERRCSCQTGRLNTSGQGRIGGRCFGCWDRQCRGPEVGQRLLQPRLCGRRAASAAGKGAPSLCQPHMAGGHRVRQGGCRVAHSPQQRPRTQGWRRDGVSAGGPSSARRAPQSEWWVSAAGSLLTAFSLASVPLVTSLPGLPLPACPALSGRASEWAVPRGFMPSPFSAPGTTR